MSIKMRKHTERAQRVDLFLDGGAADFPANSKGGLLAAKIKEELNNLAHLATARSASKSRRRQGTAGRHDTRATLRQLIEAVADTSKSAAHEIPSIKGLFELGDKDRSDATLVATARAFADVAPPFVTLFAEYGLPANLVNDLRAGADTLEQNMLLQTEGRGAGVSTTASAEETYQRINDLVERLDPIVRNKYQSNPAKVTAWERARRVESASHPKSNGNIEPAPPPPDGNQAG